jgi:hypothetical protein
VEFEEPDWCRAAKDEHRLECAPERQFLLDHVRAGAETDFVPSEEIYSAYRTEMETGHHGSLSRARFNQAVREMFPVVSDLPDRGRVQEGRRVRGFHGIAFSAELLEPEGGEDHG